MNVVVVGGVAAGTKAAAKLKRRDRSANVTIYTKSKEISYAGCALPYYAGGIIESAGDLTVHTPTSYSALTGVQVKTQMEAVSLDAGKKTVTFANGEVVSYDKLIIATGAVPFVPDLPGKDLDGVFTMRTPEDAVHLRAYVDENKCRHAVIAGAGFIGLEIAENLHAKGMNVTVVDLAKQVLPNLFDPEMADYIRRQLQAKGIRIVTGTGIEEIISSSVDDSGNADNAGSASAGSTGNASAGSTGSASTEGTGSASTEGTGSTNTESTGSASAENTGSASADNASDANSTGKGKASGIRTGAGTFRGDLVILAIGIRPATEWLDGSGIETNRGTIAVDRYQKTNLKDVYAVGDCAQVFNRITGNPQWSAMGSTANITGRLLAKNLTGESRANDSGISRYTDDAAVTGDFAAYGGCLGTGVVRLTDTLNAGRTGLTEEQARAQGYDVITASCVMDDKAHYYPGSSPFLIKLVADASSRKLLGLQVLGAGAVDKMVDIAVTGISLGAVIEDFDTLDFAYAPPFSTAMHPFQQACYVLENKMNGEYNSMTPAEYAAGKAKGYTIIDASPRPSVPGAKWVDLAKADGSIEGFDKNAKILLVCAKGKRGYLLQNRLKSFGYTDTLVLEGGLALNQVKVSFDGRKLPPEEIKRVKGLGFLQDKRYPDIFNARVITRNGHISTDEHRAIAEAADRFGSGAISMTTRLTMEVQGIKYDNIQPFIDFLGQHGLTTGGTGSLVRPVVSCKGTTCQYGLADTYDLSEKIHERFYIGYHTVTLPHKFKIAVGGCPNNCVKPSLNDVGIVGQKVPMIDYSKCLGCKKCRIESSCPIKIAKVVDGKIHVDPNACNNCGRCAGKCPFGVFEEYQHGFRMYIGGRWGKKVAHGQPLTKIFHSEEEIMDAVEKAILLFRDEGISGERFADTIERLGFDYVNDKLINQEIDKTAILHKNVLGGATC